ncbi:hypothetical protein RJ55_05357 [Drechmeria coniospora]|nr:hypothetical protein RJ55_05357 [Drechmeria coniospora]
MLPRCRLTLLLSILLAGIGWPLGVCAYSVGRYKVPRGLGNDKPTRLFRGDLRSPEKIWKAGGFLPHGNDLNNDAGLSVYAHMRGVSGGGAPENSLFVSTTTDPKVAIRALGGKPGYIYELQPTENIFSVSETLKGHNLYPNQQEWVALGGIRADQIRSVAQVGASTSSSNNGASPELTFKPSRGFLASKWANNGVGDPQPELAGFPRDHPAAKDEPFWRSLRGKPLKQAGQRLLKQAHDKGWDSPLQHSRSVVKSALGFLLCNRGQEQECGREQLEFHRLKALAKQKETWMRMGHHDRNSYRNSSKFRMLLRELPFKSFAKSIVTMGAADHPPTTDNVYCHPGFLGIGALFPSASCVRSGGLLPPDEKDLFLSLPSEEQHDFLALTAEEQHKRVVEAMGPETYQFREDCRRNKPLLSLSAPSEEECVVAKLTQAEAESAEEAEGKRASKATSLAHEHSPSLPGGLRNVSASVPTSTIRSQDVDEDDDAGPDGVHRQRRARGTVGVDFVA